MKKVFLFTSSILLFLTLNGCLPTRATENETPSGFFKGIGHGWIAPILLIVEIFDSNVRIYEDNNSGWGYDIGYYMAIISGFGGLDLSRKNERLSNEKSFLRLK